MKIQESLHRHFAPRQDKSCRVDPLEKALDESRSESAMAAFLAVSGMGCPNCAMRVRNELLGLDGVLAVHVDLEQGLAATAYDPDRISPEDLFQAVASAGNDGRHHYRAQYIQQVPVSWLLR